jgi:DNA polymerase III delta prime subunit
LNQMAHIFLIAGAPAVGKSTTAHALATKFERSIHISVDDLREMVVSGIVRPGGNWNHSLIEQLTLARQSAMQMAITYNKADFVVVIDDFWDPNSQLLEYGLLFQEPNVHKILLFPSQQVAEERNLQRSGSVEGSQYIADGIRTVYESLKADIRNLENQGWIIADTSEKNVEATVKHILSQVR